VRVRMRARSSGKSVRVRLGSFDAVSEQGLQFLSVHLDSIVILGVGPDPVSVATCVGVRVVCLSVCAAGPAGRACHCQYRGRLSTACRECRIPHDPNTPGTESSRFCALVALRCGI